MGKPPFTLIMLQKTKVPFLPMQTALRVVPHLRIMRMAQRLQQSTTQMV